MLVGVTKWCADVAAVEGLPKLGDCWRMETVEEIARLKPTLVIGSVPFKGETIEKILKEPVTFLALNPRTLADVESDIRLVARVVDRAAAGEKAISVMRREFARIRERARKRKNRVRVYCEAWPKPRISSPPWVEELVEMCGGELVVKAGQRVSEDEVAAARPEVMVLAWAAMGPEADPKKAYAVEQWKNVPAIREKRVLVMRDELLNTPGPILVKGAIELQKLLQHRERGVQNTKGAERA